MIIALNAYFNAKINICKQKLVQYLQMKQGRSCLRYWGIVTTKLLLFFLPKADCGGFWSGFR